MKYANQKIGASVFGQVWKDPNDPQWTSDVKFPRGSAVFKVNNTSFKRETPGSQYLDTTF